MTLLSFFAIQTIFDIVAKILKNSLDKFIVVMSDCNMKKSVSIQVGTKEMCTTIKKRFTDFIMTTIGCKMKRS